MNTFTTWGEVLTMSFRTLWTSIANILPDIIGALLVLVIGLIIAVALANLIKGIVDFLQVDKAIDKLGLTKSLSKAGLKFSFGELVRWLVKWFLIIIFFIAAADIMGWSQINMFLTRVVLYIPNVIISVTILLVGILVANFVREVVSKAVKAAKLESAAFLSGVAKWAILIFSFMAALIQLRIAVELIQTLFTGLVAMLALAGGLAFGLGGKEQAGQFLTRLKKDISER